MYSIYYIKNNYMFRHFSLAIFRLINEKKTLVSSYTRLVCVVYSGEVRGEVGTRSRICCVGWVVWVHGFCYCILFEAKIVGSMVSIAKIPEPMYPHRPSYTTHARSRTHLTSYLPTVYNTHKSSIAAC